MIRAQNLSKSFDDFQAVDQINLEVGKGEVLALLGPNGAGKTTTVRMLTSILRPTSGKATIAGYDVVTHPKEVRSSVGVLTEHHGLYNRMTGEDYLDFYGELYSLSKAERKKRINQLLERFGLDDARSKRIGEYSKGMRQKLALARSLIHKPPVLLLDEPTSAMDPESARLVRDSIRELRSDERSVVICTHNLVEAEELADRIAIIRHGKIIAHGSPDDLKAKMLGPAAYEVKFSSNLNGKKPELPSSVEVMEFGPDWIRFSSNDPKNINSLVLKSVLEQGFSVLRLAEVPRTLEAVYLKAVKAAAKREDDNNG